MAHGITGIDHAQWSVGERETATAALRRLGFTVAPPGLIFQRGAVALMDGAEPGLRGIAFATPDLDASRASLLAAGIAADGETLPAEATPGLNGQLCLPWDQRPVEWTAHPNTAVSLQSVTVLADHPEASMAAYDKLFGLFATTPTDEMVTVHTGSGLIFVVSPDGFDHLHPQMTLRLPAAPALVALTIGVADLGAAERVLKAAGVAYRISGETLTVDPAAALGIGLELVGE